MPIVYKITSLISFLFLLILGIFTYSLYINEVKILNEREKVRQETIANSFYKMATESILSQDDLSLISYTFKLIENEGLKEAFIYDGEKYLSHTNKNIVRRKLPLDLKQAPTDIVYLKELNINDKKYIAKVSFDKKTIENNINNTIHNSFKQILKFSVIAFILGIIGSYILALNITKPIREIAIAAKEVGKGNLYFHIETTNNKKTKNEIEILKMEFNEMIKKLKELDEMKKDFISAVTHELKSPIGIIDSYTEILSRDLKKLPDDISNKWQQDISCIKQNLKRLSSFIADLLDAAKIEKGQFEINRKKCDFKEFVQNLIENFKPEAEKLNIEINLEYNSIHNEVEIDSERIYQVFSNLISNALKYTPSGGKINIKISDYKIGNENYEKLLLISVQDNGIGIPLEFQEKIFEKFTQLKTNIKEKPKIGRNVGLGLYIVKNIIEKHNGKIWVESQPGKGSSFNFILPL